MLQKPLEQWWVSEGGAIKVSFRQVMALDLCLENGYVWEKTGISGEDDWMVHSRDNEEASNC